MQRGGIMSEPIFREKSLEKVKSPDNLNEYIRVSNPGVWTLMAAVVFLLVGFCIWGIFGQLKTTVEADAHCENGVITCYLNDADVKRITPGMSVEIGKATGAVAEISVREENKSTCTISTTEPLPDGIYGVRINVEAIHPMSFLVN